VPICPAPNTSVPPPSQRDGPAPNWWGDALAKVKTIATTLGKDGEPIPEQSDKYGGVYGGSGGGGSRDQRSSTSHRSSNQHRSDSRERKYDRDRGRDRGRDRSRERDRSRSRNARDSDRSRHRDQPRERQKSGSDGRGGRGRVKEENIKKEPQTYGYKSDNYEKSTKVEVKSEVKNEPRDIDMRKGRRESNESYSPTRPDYKPTVKSEDYSAGGAATLPSVVEELASMVAVSGEDLEDIARDRNKHTPELKFLYERTGHLYKKYRARVAELKRSFEETKQEIKSETGTELKTESGPGTSFKSGPSTSSAPPEPTRKRKSRWGGPQPDTPALLPPPGLVNLAPALGPPGLGAPGIAIPMALGGTVQQLMAPAPAPLDIKPASGLLGYAQKVFGTTNLSDQQWKQCEDQMKMSVVYGQLAAKQAAAKIMAAAGKKQMEYDSDEETEGGTWEHKARMAEMAKTAPDACKLTEVAEEAGKHHIGDFLPPEELSKFMNKYKAMRSGTAWDNSEYQENRLGQSNLGFKMLRNHCANRKVWQRG